ncbi:MAG TPA: hypothetical protein VFK26_00565, partial [Gemmatimonadaceae bacterium]|nr:hypothetical protein [Gemmatimonadaceae bacterium]
MMRHLLFVGATLGALTGCGSGPKPAAAPSPSPVASSPGTMSLSEAMSRRVPDCPGGNGIRISATPGTLVDSTSGSSRGTTAVRSDSTAGVNADVGLGQAIDTTLVFNFARKTWTRTNLSAAISVGIADESRGRYAICAGVNALLPTATLTITGAHGTVHFAADLRQFT